MRPELRRIAGELECWLPCETEEFVTLLFRLLAGLPGGELAEEAGYEPLCLGWKEADLLGRTLVALRDAGDVAWLTSRLLRLDAGDME